MCCSNNNKKQKDTYTSILCTYFMFLYAHDSQNICVVYRDREPAPISLFAVHVFPIHLGWKTYGWKVILIRVISSLLLRFLII